MANDNVANIICEERMDGTVNQMIKTGLTKRQYKRLDKADCAKNLMTADYGRIAYIQGMKDGFQLAQLLNRKQKPEI